VIYLASPYSGNEEQNFRLAMDACRVYFQNGIPVFSPIAHWHPVAMAFGLETSADHYAVQNAAGVKCCAEVHILKIPGYDKSKGIAKEIGWSRLSGKEVSIVSVNEQSVTIDHVIDDIEMLQWMQYFEIKI